MKGKRFWPLIGALMVTLMAGPAWSQAKPVPVRQGLVWKGTVVRKLPDCANGADPLRKDGAIERYLSDDGGTFTDDTTDIGSAATGDVTIFPATPAVDDAVYFGSREKFDLLRFDIGTQGVTSMTVLWEYYNGTAWTTLTLVHEGVDDFDEAAGFHTNSWSIPADWATVTVDAFGARYWVRARVSAFTSVTTPAVMDQAWIGREAADNVANQVVIRSDPDEAEVVWCDATSGAGIDAAFPLDAGTGALTVEVQGYAGEIWCCGDGGEVDFFGVMMRER